MVVSLIAFTSVQFVSHQSSITPQLTTRITPLFGRLDIRLFALTDFCSNRGNTTHIFLGKCFLGGCGLRPRRKRGLVGNNRLGRSRIHQLLFQHRFCPLELSLEWVCRLRRGAQGALSATHRPQRQLRWFSDLEKGRRFLQQG